MNTPIYDFVRKYSDSDISRLHMPGHKGSGFLDVEKYDITEIKGADSLYEAEGIIRESEENASRIFGSGATFYSAEGSSLSVRAMIYAALMKRGKGVPARIAAVRNVHKSFVYACAALDIDIVWVYPKNRESLCGGTVTAEEAENILCENDVFAFYLTSPTYTGELTDIRSVSDVCRKYNVPLLVDNAHGAYLRFTGCHPINNGAAMCCDSAHKTLPVLTGGGYLHVSDEYADVYAGCIKNAMTFFGSTSPSYLILTSLDLCNKYMAEEYPEKIEKTICDVNGLREYILKKGFEISGNEPLKITVKTNGEKAAEVLRRFGAECEYSDKSCIVLMFAPGNNEEDYEKIKSAFAEAELSSPGKAPYIPECRKVISVREAMLSLYETVDVRKASGRVCAAPAVSCPPAIPVVVSGELITDEIAEVLDYYGYDKINCMEECNLEK